MLGCARLYAVAPVPVDDLGFLGFGMRSWGPGSRLGFGGSEAKAGVWDDEGGQGKWDTSVFLGITLRWNGGHTALNELWQGCLTLLPEHTVPYCKPAARESKVLGTGEVKCV